MYHDYRVSVSLYVARWFGRPLQVAVARVRPPFPACRLLILWLPGLVLPASCSHSRSLVTSAGGSLSPISGWRRYMPSNTNPRARPRRGLRGGMPHMIQVCIILSSDWHLKNLSFNLTLMCMVFLSVVSYLLVCWVLTQFFGSMALCGPQDCHLYNIALYQNSVTLSDITQRKLVHLSYFFPPDFPKHSCPHQWC
jgi:hypothetical protein